MFEGVGDLIKYVADGNHSLFKRLIIIALIALPIIMVDSQIGFTYYYGVSHKIEGIEKIETLIKNDSINPTTKKELLALEKDLIHHQALSSRLWSFISFSTSTTSSVKAPKGAIKNKPINIDKDRLILHLVSSGILFIIGLLTAFVYLLFNIYRKNRTYTEAASLVCIVFLFLTYLVPAFLWQIPVIAGRPWINYIINLNVQVGILWWSYGRFLTLKEKDKMKNS